MFGRFSFSISRKTKHYDKYLKKSLCKKCTYSPLNIFENEQLLKISSNPYILKYAGIERDIRNSGGASDNTIWYQLNESSFDGDIREEWEMMRLQNLNLCLSNYLITKNNQIIGEINTILEKWFSLNKIDYGYAHISNLEIAIRFLTFYRLQFYLKDKLDIDMIDILRRYAIHIYYDLHRTNLCIPNNHSLGEAIILLLASKIFGESKWENYSKKTIRSRLDLINEYGESTEESSGYHLFVHQMFLVLLSICDDFDNELLPRIMKSKRILEKLSDRDGNIGLFGDCDDGLFFVFDSFNRNNIKSIYCPYLKSFDKVKTFECNISLIDTKESKYLLVKEKGDFKVALIGGYDINHAHVQSLSFLLWVKGKQVVFAPGTYRYNGPEGSIRLELGSSEMSNTPSILLRNNFVTKFRHKRIIKKVELTDRDNSIEGVICFKNNIAKRSISLGNDSITIEDSCNSDFKFNICIDSESKINIEPSDNINEKNDKYSPSYGVLETKKYLYFSSKNNKNKVVIAA